MVIKYKYWGRVIDEFQDLNAMVDDRAKAGRRGPWFPAPGAQSAVGVLFGHIFKKLLDFMVQSVLLELKLGVALNAWNPRSRLS